MSKIMRLAGFALIAASAMSFAQAADSVDAPPIKIRQTVTEFRSVLLKAGWKPVETFRKERGGEYYHSLFGAGSMYEAGVIEVESCTGVELNNCFYNYEKDGTCLRVSTQGEYHPEWQTEPKLIAWKFACTKLDGSF